MHRVVHFLLAAGLAAPLAAQGDLLFTVASSDDQLRTINPNTGATVTAIPITLAGKTVDGGTGLAQDPTTGTLWAILKN